MDYHDSSRIDISLREIRTACVELWINMINSKDSFGEMQDIINKIDKILFDRQNNSSFYTFLACSTFTNELKPRILKIFPKNDNLISKLKEQLISLLKRVFDPINKNKSLQSKYDNLQKKLAQDRYFLVQQDVEKLFNMLSKAYSKEIKIPDIIAKISRALSSIFSLQGNMEIIQKFYENYIAFSIGTLMVKRYSQKLGTRNFLSKHDISGDLTIDEIDLPLQQNVIKRNIAISKQNNNSHINILAFSMIFIFLFTVVVIFDNNRLQL